MIQKQIKFVQQGSTKIKKFLIKNGFIGRWDKTNKHFKVITVESLERKVFPLGKNIYTELPPNIKTI